MADQNGILHRAGLEVELEDAQRDLAHLQDLAKEMSSDFLGISHELEHDAALMPSASDFNVEPELASRLDLDQTLDIVAARSLISQMSAARKRVYNLESRKRRLASPAGLTISS
jgi:hypothetical protein